MPPKQKIHTRNFVGKSGKVYVGSKQGYRADESDKSEYPGGYVMTYDPRTGATENLGMPFAGQGVADVVADEARDLLYVVTCEDQHWMLRDPGRKDYRELGPMLTPYAMTLIASDGCGYALTEDFQLARYNPADKKVDVRPIDVEGRRFQRANRASIPTWILTPDKKRAYLILMNDPTLLEIELVGDSPTVKAISHGKMLEGEKARLPLWRLPWAPMATSMPRFELTTKRVSEKVTCTTWSGIYRLKRRWRTWESLPSRIPTTFLGIKRGRTESLKSGRTDSIDFPTDR